MYICRFFFCVQKLAIFCQICPPEFEPIFFHKNLSCQFHKFVLLHAALTFLFVLPAALTFLFRLPAVLTILFSLQKLCKIRVLFLGFVEFFVQSSSLFKRLHSVFLCWLEHRNIIPLLKSVLRGYQYLKSLLQNTSAKTLNLEPASASTV